MFTADYMTSENWRKMIQLYSRRKFTYENDILPALSGITNRVRGAGKYFGGLWEKTLPYDLLWFPTSRLSHLSTDLPTFRTAYVAPTFLWAAINGGVSFVDTKPDTRRFNQTFSVESIGLISKDEDPLGPLSGGQLTLKGSAIRAKFVCYFQRPMPADIFIKDLEPGQESLWAVLECPGLERAGSFRHYIYHPDTLNESAEQGDDILCLQLFESRVDDRCYALVLYVPRSKPGVTYRVGIIGSIEKYHFHSASVEQVTVI